MGLEKKLVYQNATEKKPCWTPAALFLELLQRGGRKSLNGLILIAVINFEISGLNVLDFHVFHARFVESVNVALIGQQRCREALIIFKIDRKMIVCKL